MNNNNYLNLSQTTKLRGILIIGIILHHLALEYSNIMVIKPFKYLGFLICGVFFFLSGYGLEVSLKNKKGYLKNFNKKILITLLNLGIAFLIYLTLYSIMKIKFDVVNAVPYSWFIYELLFFYIIFYICNTKIKGNKSIIVIGIITILSLFIVYFLGFEDYWYKSAIPFVFGSLVAVKKDELIKLLQDNYAIKCCIAVLLLTISLIIGKYYNLKALNIIFYNLSSTLFTMIIMMLLYKIKDFKLEKLSTIGKMSLDIYLYHGLFIILLQRISQNEYINVILTLIFSIILGYIMHYINEKIAILLKLKKSVNKLNNI